MKAVKIIVLADRSCGVLDALKAIFKSKGVAPAFECREWSGSVSQIHVEVSLPTEGELDPLLRAVEAVKGAAVMAAAEVERRS